MTLFITSILSILFLFLFWNILWKKYSLDKLREELFTIRNELFDLANKKDNNFSFNDKIYLDFEKMLNGTIRYAHNISIFQYLIFNVFWRQKNAQFKIESKFEKDFKLYINALTNKKLIDKLKSLRTRYSNEIIKHIIRNSLIMILYTTLISIIFFTKELYKLSVFTIKNIKVKDVPNIEVFQNTRNDIKEAFTKAINDIEYKSEACVV